MQEHAEGLGDTCSTPKDARANEHVDWSTLIILLEADNDGEGNVLVNEDQIYEDMGFKELDEGVVAKEVPIPNTEMEA